MSQAANAHVHPAFAGVLNSFAAIPQMVANATLSQVRERTCPPCHGDCNQGRTCPARSRSERSAALVKCRVAVKTEDGETTYDGLFPSTCDAVIDAQNRVGLRPCKVSVKVQP